MDKEAAAERRAEVESKLALLRQALNDRDLGGVRLRGVDWFSWATAGGSDVVLLTAETGVAEIFVTPTEAYVLTDVIEAARLVREEVPEPWRVWSAPWQEPMRREAFVRDLAGGKQVASDRPAPGECLLPAVIKLAKRRLTAGEIGRYRSLAVDAASAMTAVLGAARPEWSEHRLAAAGSRELWIRGIHPALTLVAGAARLPLYRHPTASAAPLGERAMLVFCARRHGLYANLTRFVYFRRPDAATHDLKTSCAAVEAAAFRRSAPGATLASVYDALVQEYAAVGHGGEELKHHQGGVTGYLAREEIASPTSDSLLADGMALAWNPSLPAMKMEDTVLCHAAGIEVLTIDPAWPTFTVDGRLRPDFLVAP
jgi:Xaa-Pro aminopeptidase